MKTSLLALSVFLFFICSAHFPSFLRQELIFPNDVQAQETSRLLIYYDYESQTDCEENNDGTRAGGYNLLLIDTCSLSSHLFSYVSCDETEIKIYEGVEDCDAFDPETADALNFTLTKGCDQSPYTNPVCVEQPPGSFVRWIRTPTSLEDTSLTCDDREAREQILESDERSPEFADGSCVDSYFQFSCNSDPSTGGKVTVYQESNCEGEAVEHSFRNWECTPNRNPGRFIYITCDGKSFDGNIIDPEPEDEDPDDEGNVATSAIKFSRFIHATLLTASFTILSILL